MMQVDILVVGSVNADLLVTVERPPSPGETVFARSLADRPGGKGANQAVAAATAGATTALVACVGDDAAGVQQVRALTAAGVDVSAIRRVAGVPTGAAIVVVSGSGENSIVVAPGANAELAANEVTAAICALAPRLVLIQTEVPAELVEQVATVCRQRELRMVLNCAPVVPLHPTALSQADPLVVNEHEARDLLGAPITGNPAGALRGVVGAASAIVTLGARGAAFADARQAGVVPAARVDPVDTTGAGDWFTGSLAAALTHGVGLAEATRNATEAAAAAVGWTGARPPAPMPIVIEEVIR
jgi:ribokinase